jgi:hypothetical protein
LAGVAWLVPSIRNIETEIPDALPEPERVSELS